LHALSVYLLFNPSIAYNRSISKIRTIIGAIDYGTGTNSLKKHAKETKGKTKENIGEYRGNYIDQLNKILNQFNTLVGPSAKVYICW
jgi:hypothetical protein